MKRLGIAFALVLLLIAPGSAQEGSGLEVLLSSGLAFPASPMTFANYWKMQYGGSLGLGFELSPSVTLVGSVEYYQFTLDAAGVSEHFDTEYAQSIWIFDDVSLNPSADPSSVLTVAASIRVAPPGISEILPPYILAGGGMMRFALKEISMPMTSSLALTTSTIAMTAEQKITGGTETAGFLQAGLGFLLNVSNTVKPFAEARYVFGFTSGATTSYIPVTVGVKFGW